MLYDILLVAGGAVGATVIWYLILRNNKKKFAEWMDTTEIYFMTAIGKIDDLSDAAAAEIEEIFASFKKMKK